MRPFDRLVSCGLMIGLLTLLGCGGSDDGDRPARVPVTGVVRLNGEPVAGAAVTFRPDSGAHAAVAETDSEGHYSLMTFDPGDGAVPGSYGVQVVKYEPINPDDQHGKTPDLKNLLPEKYSKHTSSGLKFSVSADQTNVYDIDLE